jgi:polyhydroxyalkanoate synthesis regulator phasin
MEIMIKRKNEISPNRARAMARSLLRDIRTITSDYEEQQKIDIMCDDLYNEEQARRLKEI